MRRSKVLEERRKQVNPEVRDSIAKNYYIDGFRGEPKKVSLPQELIIWE